MRPAAIRFGLTTEPAGQPFLAEISGATRQRQGVGMSPLLVSARKHKPPDSDDPICDTERRRPGVGNDITMRGAVGIPRARSGNWQRR